MTCFKHGLGKALPILQPQVQRFQSPDQRTVPGIIDIIRVQEPLILLHQRPVPPGHRPLRPEGKKPTGEPNRYQIGDHHQSADPDHNLVCQPGPIHLFRIASQNLKYAEEGQQPQRSLIQYEPNCEDVFNAVIPEYIAGIIYSALCESLASELAARRTAMDAASKNAAEMIENLNLYYNRARQAAITQEITEIVGGAEH